MHYHSVSIAVGLFCFRYFTGLGETALSQYLPVTAVLYTHHRNPGGKATEQWEAAVEFRV